MESLSLEPPTSKSQLAVARALLSAPRRKAGPAWPALLAALLLCVSSLFFAYVAIAVSPPGFEPVPVVKGGGS